MIGIVLGFDALFYADDNLLNKTKSVLKNLYFNFKIGEKSSGDQVVHSLETGVEVNEIYSDNYAVEMETSQNVSLVLKELISIL